MIQKCLEKLQFRSWIVFLSPVVWASNLGVPLLKVFQKKSFGLEIRDADNKGLSVSLLGLPEEEDWILYGPYSDKSLMRNVLIYDLARKMGDYASRTTFVELTINKEYRGIYVFMEKLKRGRKQNKYRQVEV